MDQVGKLDLEVVYREHHARLWRSLLAFSGDPDVASDAESEAFAQAARRGSAIDDAAAWVWRSAFRIAAGMLATRSLGGVTPAPVVSNPTIEPSTAEFIAVLGSLSEQQRACVVLRYSGGYTPAEIAGLLETSAGTVRVQLHRAHQSLRLTLAVDDD